MGKLLGSFAKTLVDEIQTGINANVSHWYAIAANPVAHTGNTPVTTGDDYSTLFKNDWMMLFGKKLLANNVFAMVDRIDWVANTVYDRYDDRADLINSNFYVITPPTTSSGYFNVYKCIDNGAGNASLIAPSLVQPESFKIEDDGYIWRYITSIDYVTFARYATTKYSPMNANSTIQASAFNYAGVETLVVEDGGSGYQTHHNGTINGLISPTEIQIANDAVTVSNYYVNNSIYLYDTNAGTGALRNIVGYTSTIGVGNFVTLDEAVNTQLFTALSSQYKISPQVYFETDASDKPKAYSVVNTMNNSIDSIVVVKPGSGLTWANVTIVSNSSYGTGANVRAIVPPPGGHGYNPPAELGGTGIGISFTFSNTELNTISTDLTYDRIGIARNIYGISQDGNATKSGTLLNSNTINQILKANINPTGVVFTVGDIVTGQTSGAHGMVVFSNSTVLHLSGDKYFNANGETVVSSDGSLSTSIQINTYGDAYMADVFPLYAQNIDNVTRSNTQAETYKLIIQL
jgi:hypothetical protein